MNDWSFTYKGIRSWNDVVNYVFHSDKHYSHKECTVIKVNDDCIEITHKRKPVYKTPEEAIIYLNNTFKF